MLLLVHNRTLSVFYYLHVKYSKYIKKYINNITNIVSIKSTDINKGVQLLYNIQFSIKHIESRTLSIFIYYEMERTISFVNAIRKIYSSSYNEP